jgi:hypothetical protein
LQAPKHPKALQNQAVDAGSIPGASSTNPLTSQRNFPRQVEWTRFGSESPAEIALMIETKRCAYVIEPGSSPYCGAEAKWRTWDCTTLCDDHNAAVEGRDCRPPHGRPLDHSDQIVVVAAAEAPGSAQIAEPVDAVFG